MRTCAEQTLRQLLRKLNPYMSRHWLADTKAIWAEWIRELGIQRDAMDWNAVQAIAKLVTKHPQMRQMVGLAYCRMVEAIVDQARMVWDHTDCVQLYRQDPVLYRHLCERLREAFDPRQEVAREDPERYLGELIVYHLTSAYRLEDPMRMLTMSQNAYFTGKQKLVYACCTDVGNALLSAYEEYEVLCGAASGFLPEAEDAAEEKEELVVNQIQMAIETLEAIDHRDHQQEWMLRLLKTKAGELGENPTREAVAEALRQAEEAFAKRYPRKEECEPEVPDWGPEMLRNIETIRDVFGDMDVKHREYFQRENIYAFELSATNEGRELCVKVFVEEDPMCCRIDAIFPFKAEPEFAWPLCAKLAAENYNNRYGALQYDASDQELSCRYSFSIKHGLYGDDFYDALHCVLWCAFECYDAVKHCAVGRFRRSEREQIICKAQNLIIELDA